MKTSAAGIEFIKNFESFKADAYRCPAGVLTIGYGHTEGVKSSDHVTEQEATRMLMNDISKAERAVNTMYIPLNQEQFDALVSFVYNVGVGAFNSSTLKKRVESFCYDPRIKDEFMKWVKADGKTLNGLVKRREAEADLYFT